MLDVGEPLSPIYLKRVQAAPRALPNMEVRRQPVADTAIEQYVRSLPLRHPQSRRIYRSELIACQRFIQRSGDGSWRSRDDCVDPRPSS
jgi:hypothetical protein